VVNSQAKYRLPRSELLRQLGDSVGAEKTEEMMAAVHAAAIRHGVQDASDYDREQTLVLLEDLARSDGLIGIVARFAKVRMILKFED
jgi:hypothetical protein